MDENINLKEAVKLSPSDNLNSELDDELIHQLYQTMRAFSKTLNNEIYATGVYSSEWSILKLVKEQEGSFSQLELANMLNVEPAAISKTLTKMEEKNLVRRCRIQGKREKYIFLTEQSKEIYASLEKTVEAHRFKALKNLSERDKEILRILMHRIYHNILGK